MTDLSDFGVTRKIDPPTIERRQKIRVGVGNETRITGAVGPTNRDTIGYVTRRDSNKHRLQALDVYAISDRVLSRLESLNVETVLVAVIDTKHVREYDLDGFDTPVPLKYLETANDKQKFAAYGPTHIWENHYPDVFGEVGE